MRIDSDGRCHLIKGEIIPVHCVTCGKFYEPERDSLASSCRYCGHFTLHWEVMLQIVLHDVKGAHDGAGSCDFGEG